MIDRVSQYQIGWSWKVAGNFSFGRIIRLILFGSNLIEQVPIAALVGVMFMVVIGTFAWSTFKVLNKVPKSDVIVIMLVTD